MRDDVILSTQANVLAPSYTGRLYHSAHSLFYWEATGLTLSPTGLIVYYTWTLLTLA